MHLAGEPLVEDRDTRLHQLRGVQLALVAQQGSSDYGALAATLALGVGVILVAGGIGVLRVSAVHWTVWLAAFAVTALLLHRMAGGRPDRQLRAALLWAANPLLLQVLVAGGHVDVQLVVFCVAAVAALYGAGEPTVLRALAAGTHTDARDPTGTWAVRAKLAPERVQLELTRPSGVVS